MHYRSGRPAKAGDLVIQTVKMTQNGFQQTVGILTGATAGNSTCNGTLRPIAQRSSTDAGEGPWLPFHGIGDNWVNLSDCDAAVEEKTWTAPVNTHDETGTPPPTGGGPGDPHPGGPGGD